MTNKEKIIISYYEKRLNTITISKNLRISKQYVSKIIIIVMDYILIHNNNYYFLF